jgi:AcrR family transcriptional regulator
VVSAAVKIADADGLPAVSIRRVAAMLGARTMSLYSHIDGKDDLLDLMREQVAAESLVRGELPDGWREAIVGIAAREREVALRHPWVIHLIGHPGHVGPNALRHLEQSLRVLTRLTGDARVALDVAAAVDQYVLGHVISEVTRGPARAIVAPYTRMLLDNGEFPTLAPLVARGFGPNGNNFEDGLNWLLDGVERAYGA